MEKMTLTIEGIAPFMPTSTVSLDDEHELKVRLKQLTDIKASKRTAEVKIALRHTEWLIAMATSFDAKIGPFIPGWNITRVIRNAARASKRGKTIERAVLPGEDNCPLIYKGPRTLDGLWADPRFQDRRAVVNKGTGGAVLRTRAVFPEWKVVCPLLFDSALIDAKDIYEIAVEAGKYEGIGQYRPRFGRFNVTGKN